MISALGNSTLPLFFFASLAVSFFPFFPTTSHFPSDAILDFHRAKESREISPHDSVGKKEEIGIPRQNAKCLLNSK